MLDFIAKLEKVPKHLAILGGTFDPIHLGHLVTGEAALSLPEIDQVLFLPSGNPPHKEGLQITPADVRYEMTKCAIADRPSFLVSNMEIIRPGRTYTLDTIHTLHQELPDTHIHFIIGADAFMEMPTWYHADELLHACSFLVASRPGFSLELDPEAFKDVDFQMLEVPLLEISSTDIRHRIQSGRSIRYLTTDTVRKFIAEHSLYSGGEA